MPPVRFSLSRRGTDAVGSDCADEGSQGLLESAVERFLATSLQDWSPIEQERLCHLVVDAIACAVAGARSDVVVRLGEGLRGFAGVTPPGLASQAVMLAIPGPTGVGAAIAMNTCMIRQLDLMDVFWDKDVCHPSEVVGAAFALGAALGSSGADVLAAVGAAYEFQVGLSRLAAYSAHGLHHVSAAGFIVPMVYGRLAGLPVTQVVNAAALGGTRRNVLGALSRGHLSSAKSLAYGLSAMEALTDVSLAVAGLSGPVSALGWYLENLAGTKVSPSVFSGAGDGAILAVSLKQFPAQFALQGPIEAAIGAAADGPADAHPVSISVAAPASTLARTTDAGKLRPDNRETADHSLYSCVAMAVADGRVDVASMYAGRWADDDVVALAEVIEAIESAELDAQNPGGGPARVSISWSDGSVTDRTVIHPQGDARNPLDGASLREKFLSLTVPELGSSGEMLWDLLMGLPRSRDVTEIVRATHLREGAS